MIELRELSTLDEFRACVELQKVTWGEDFLDIVPSSILQVTHKMGGFVGGAFEDSDLVGFVYSVAGRYRGEQAHWSHMLAVAERTQGQGVGRRLKIFQRDAVLRSGVNSMYWTFDPLVARNAHLNLNRLGATVVEYVENMYGAETGSPLHAGVDTDRLIVKWDLVSTPGSPPTGELGGDAGEDAVMVEIPSNLDALPGPKTLAHWRLEVRKELRDQMRRGYEIRNLVRYRAEDRCFYRLLRKKNP